VLSRTVSETKQSYRRKLILILLLKTKEVVDFTNNLTFSYIMYTRISLPPNPPLKKSGFWNVVCMYVCMDVRLARTSTVERILFIFGI
jgi:hypothetical protein